MLKYVHVHENLLSYNNVFGFRHYMVIGFIIINNLSRKKCNKMKDVRKSGRTTRLVDEFIQLLFEVDKGQIVQVRDHYPSNDAHRMLLNKIALRLKNEHPEVAFEIDYRSRTIKRR